MQEKKKEAVQEEEKDLAIAQPEVKPETPSPEDVRTLPPAETCAQPDTQSEHSCVEACPHSGKRENCTWHNPARCPWGKRQ